MTRANRHRIQRQILELTVGSAAEGPAAHQALARPFWDCAVPELEHVFDRAAGPDELLRLERLELDLGTISGGEWPMEFRRRLIAELTRTLAQFTAVSEPGTDGRGNPRPAEAWRQFLFFLAHGRLPWWAATPLKHWNAVLSNLSDAHWNTLREVVSSDTRARSRLVYSVSDEFLERAIACWSGVPKAARALHQLTPKHLAANGPRQWRRGFWILVLDWIAKGGFRSPHGGPHLVRELMVLRDMCESETGQPRAFHGPADDPNRLEDRAGAVDDRDLPEPWRGWRLAQGDRALFEYDVSEGPCGWRLSQGDGAPLKYDVSERPSGMEERTGRAPAGSPPPERASEKMRQEVDEEAIYLPGAGAILIHPFLEQLFRGRGLLEGRTFRGSEARHRAVHLIGFLTFGRRELPEYDLVLAKALCGIELEEPLEPVQLEDEDVSACEALLRAVLEHWTALRSSSAEWLREQFFLREGKLEDVDSGRRLTIERRAQDVLLARLPWGFGVVGLPWLTGQIFVRWLD
jgi:contractile injection system tape measure protein